MLFAIFLGACAHPLDMVLPTTVQPAHVEGLTGHHENLKSTLWVQTAAEYHATALQTFYNARLALDRALADSSWTAVVEQTGEFGSLPPAVILDVDETVLDNSAFEARLIERGGTFNAERWAAWVEERVALPIPGAVEFTRYAHSRGVEVFYVTNRTIAEEPATRDNLARAGFPLNEQIDTVLTRGEGSPEPTSDKRARREMVAQRYRVLLNIGDDFNDFISGVHVSIEERRDLAERYADYWGQRWFMLSNPNYGSWERAIIRSDQPLSREQELQRKRETLRLD